MAGSIVLNVFYVPFISVLICVRSAYQDLSSKIDTTRNPGLGEPKGKKGKVFSRSKRGTLFW